MDAAHAARGDREPVHGQGPPAVLAIDLDGTLLGPDGKVSDANVRAVGKAREAGMRVVICTGRGWAECRHILRAIDQAGEVVVAGGSIIAQGQSGRTLHRFAMASHLVEQSVGTLLEHGHAALVLKDPSEAGMDYLVIEGEDNRGRIDPITRWWFETMRLKVRTAPSLLHDEHPEHTVRVGACAPARALAPLADRLRASLGDDALLHQFGAVAPRGHDTSPSPGHPPSGEVHVLEVFDARATKWTAITHLLAQWGVGASGVAAIGDEVNDLPMLRGAGLAVAMGNAIPEARRTAHHQTRSNDQDGVAHAIEMILSGQWRARRPH